MTFTYSGQAVIPLASYQNIQPSFSVEADSLEEARELWLQEMRVIHAVFGKELPITAPVSHSNGRIYTCPLSGAKLAFDASTHTYGDGKWLSGSAFAKRFQAEFPGEVIAGKIAAKHCVNADDVLAAWSRRGEVAANFGTTLHAAVEAFGKDNELYERTKGDRWLALPANEYLADAVRQFFAPRLHEQALYEPIVIDEDRRLCGFVDRLLKTDDGLIVQDVKTNANLHKDQKILAPFKGVVEDTKLGGYWLQLSLYASIAEAAGRKVVGLEVLHWNGESWDSYEHDVIDITPGLEVING